jgi:hypothetical protein
MDKNAHVYGIHTNEKNEQFVNMYILFAMYQFY